MRISFILPGFVSRPGGGDRVIYGHANYLAMRGHVVNLVYPRRIDARSPLKRATRAVGWHLGRIGDRIRAPQRRSPVRWLSIDPRVNFLFVTNLEERSIPHADVVFATFWTTAEYVARYSAARGEKFYFIQHYEIWGGPKQKVDATWRAQMHKIVVSKWLYDLGREMGLDDIRHIPPAIDHGLFRLTNPPEVRAPSVLGLYHAQAWKGSKDALAVFHRLHERYPAMRISMFGTDRRGADIPGWMTYYRNPPQSVLAREIYNSHSIYVCASHAEGWGLPPAEAMACGCAIASTDCGGVRDFAIDGETALLSPPGDRDALYRNVCRLIDDPELCRRLRDRGTAYIQRFTWERAGRELEESLQGALAPVRIVGPNSHPPREGIIS